MVILRDKHFMLALVMLGLSGCGGGSCNCESQSSVSPQAKTVDLQLDYIGTVPVLNGNPTSSYFYIHNDGNETVYDISYSLSRRGSTKGVVPLKTSELGDINDANGFILNANSLAKCSSIPAHGYCKIEFTTPALTLGNQNNSLFQVAVTDANGVSHRYDQVINYIYFNTLLNDGINFANSSDVVANITNRRYMMGYLTGGGSANTYTNVNLILSDSSAIQVNEGFINGQEIVSGEIIPVEFSVHIISERPFPVNVTPQYMVANLQAQSRFSSYRKMDKVNILKASVVNSGQSLYVNTSSQTTSAMALKLGVIPIIPAPSSESDSPVIHVSNFGDNISGFTVEAASNKVKIYANRCTGVIESNASCSFRIGVNDNLSGSSDIYFKVNGETILTKVIYYAPIISVGAEAIVTSSVPVTEIGLTPNQTSSVINIVFSNLGNYTLTNLAFNPRVSGSSLFKIIGNSCSPSLESQSQCVIQVQLVSSNSPESGNMYLEMTGSSGSLPFSVNSGIINYFVSATSNLIISSPIGAESTLNILGNNQESTQSIFVLTNRGSQTIPISSIILDGINIPSSLRVVSNSCGSELVGNTSCNIDISYGPSEPESNISGVANLIIKYSDNSLTGTVNYSTTALDSRLAITNVSSTGFTGNGSINTPYAGSGCSSDLMSITITYKNMSENFIAENMALNIIDGHVSPYLIVDSDGTTCGYGANPKNLGVGQSCNLVLTINKDQMLGNSSYILNMIYPSASWNTSLGFIEQSNFTYNGSNTLYINYSQPVMVSSLNPSSGSSKERVLTQILGNAEGCSPVNTSISSIPYLLAANISTGNCSINSDLSMSCINDSINNTNVIQYIFDESMINGDYFIQFSQITSGIQIWYNPNVLLFKVIE